MIKLYDTTQKDSLDTTEPFCAVLRCYPKPHHKKNLNTVSENTACLHHTLLHPAFQLLLLLTIFLQLHIFIDSHS